MYSTIKNFLAMFSSSQLRYGVTSFFIALLVVLLHIFLLISFKSHELGNQVKNSLGLYLYLKDDLTGGDNRLAQITSFKDEITAHGLQLRLLTKDDALASLEKEMPHIQEQFSKYGIKNPLPSTMYIRFQDQQQFERLQGFLPNYEWLFQNFDLGALASVQQQDTRAKQVINIANMSRRTAWCVVIGIVAIILFFVIYGTMVIFMEFKKQVELDVLMGASYRHIMSPFLVYGIGQVLSGALLGLLCSYFCYSYVNRIYKEYFLMNIIDWYSVSQIGTLFVCELLILMFASGVVVMTFLRRSLKKV